MDSILLWIILFTVLGGALSVVAAATFLVLPGGIQAKLAPRVDSWSQFLTRDHHLWNSGRFRLRFGKP